MLISNGWAVGMFVMALFFGGGWAMVILWNGKPLGEWPQSWKGQSRPLLMALLIELGVAVILAALVMARLAPSWVEGGSLALLGVCCFLFWALVVSMIPAKWSWPRSRSAGMTTVVVALLLGAVSAFFVSPRVVLAIAEPGRPSPTILRTLSVVCQGHGVPEAGSYVFSFDAGPPNHLVVLNHQGAAQDWTGVMPTEWRPGSIGDTELVACVGDEVQERHDSCSYTGGAYVLTYSASRPVEVRYARTGEVIESLTLFAPAPDCPDSTRNGGNEYAETSASQLVELLRNYAHPGS